MIWTVCFALRVQVPNNHPYIVPNANLHYYNPEAEHPIITCRFFVWTLAVAAKPLPLLGFLILASLYISLKKGRLGGTLVGIRVYLGHE